MRDALVLVNCNRDNVLHCRLFALANSLRNLTCLAESDTDLALAVSYNHESGETHRAAALDGLADALDGDDLVVVLRILLIVSIAIHCHCLLFPLLEL